jgi:peptide/nickel transport system permease protein
MGLTARPFNITFCAGHVHSDFGIPSWPRCRRLSRPERLPATSELPWPPSSWSTWSLSHGIISAIRVFALDNVATFTALLGQAMPLYWFGIMLIIIFGVWLGWFPISGSDTWAHLVLPAVTLASWILPINMRMVRSGMLDVLNQDYIRTARAKGLMERKVLIKHAFKNAAIPVVTISGMQLGVLLGGAVVTETVFAWPGLGRLAVDSIRMGDYPVVQAIVVALPSSRSGQPCSDILAPLDRGSDWIIIKCLTVFLTF